MQDSRVMSALGTLLGVQMEMGGEMPNGSETSSEPAEEAKPEPKAAEEEEPMETENEDGVSQADKKAVSWWENID